MAWRAVFRVDLPAGSGYVTAKNKPSNFVNYRKHLESGYGIDQRAPAWRQPRHHLHLIALFAGVTGLAGLIGPSYDAEATRNPELNETRAAAALLESVALPPVLPETADMASLAPVAPDEPVVAMRPDPALPEENTSVIEQLAPSEPTEAAQPATVTEEAPSGKEASLVAKEEPAWQTVTVKPGDTLGGIFKQLGLSPRDVHEVVHASEETGMLGSLSPGQTMQFAIDEGELLALQFNVDPLKTLEVSKAAEGYTSTLSELEPEVRTAYSGATIESSLYGAAQTAGLSDKIVMELAELFGWDIDWANDIRKGDRFAVVFEERVLDGEKIGDGELLAAEFVNKGKTYRAIRFATSEGKVEYYTENGEGMRKAFIRTPVDFRRISSRFQPERYHPVLGVKRPHRGVDYAAATGTPVRAAGEGKIVELGWKGGYGNTIVIDHGRSYTTLYGHLSKYARGLKAGSRVRQGETIGYVGSTGLATGPHLHYEFRINGLHRDPLTVKLPNSEPVPKAHLAAFKKQSAQLLAQLEQGTKVALEPAAVDTSSH